MSTQIAAPRRNVMVGLTHTREGLAIIREPKVLKIGIGLPRGKAVDVFVDPSGDWNIRMGKAVGNTGKLKFETTAKVKTRQEAELAFRKAFDEADLCGYPRKIPYFAFTRPVMGPDGAEIYVPDFAATEAYSFADPNRPGAPTEIDVVFLGDDPFNGAFSMWSKSELRCTGDGVNAARSVAMYGDEEKVPESMREAWKEAKAAGERTFGLAEGCWSCNCPFSKEKDGKPSPCKPSGDLKFQLSRNIRVGGTAFFHTSGYRSIVQIFSAVERIKELTGGRIAGIPLKMVLRSHRTAHNGVAAIQQNVSIEFRAEDMESVRKNLIEQAWQFRAAAGLNGLPAPTKLIESAPAEAFDESPMSPQAMTDEFYVDNDDVEDATPAPATNAPATAQASAAKVADIGERLAAAAPAQAAPVLTPAQAAPVVAPAAPVVAAPAPTVAAPAAQPATTPAWSDRKAMTSALVEMKKKLGDVEFQNLLNANDIMLGSADFKDPKTAQCYAAMEARLAEMRAPQTQPQATAPATDDSRPLF